MAKSVNQILNIIKWIVIIGFIVYVVYRLEDRHNSTQYWQNPNFKTDTVRIKEVYYFRDTSGTYIPPKTVITYNAPKIDVSLNLDSIIRILRGKDTIANIDTTYLMQFPNAPKLLYGELKDSEVSLTLLKTSGAIYTQSYPVDYDHFKYRIVEDHLKAEKLTTFTTPFKKLFKAEAFMWVGYKAAQGCFGVSPEAKLSFKEFGMSLEPSFYVGNSVYSDFTVKVGYKLK